MLFLLTTSCSVVGAINSCYKYQTAFDMAITGNSDNDTPVQSQVERDKTVATDESSSELATEG